MDENENDFYDEVSRIINEQKSKLVSLISKIGEKNLRNILVEYFNIDDRLARLFIDIINDLDYINVGHSPTLRKEYTKELFLKCSKKMYAKEIAIEKESIIFSIRCYRKLDDANKSIAIKYWPNEYHEFLNEVKLKKEPSEENKSKYSEFFNDNLYDEIKMGDKDIEDDIKYSDKFSENTLACMILSKRWGLPINTIKKYTINSISKKSKRLPRNKRVEK